MSDNKDVVTAARIIAERYLVGLKVDDIKEAMVSAMLEYADLRELKLANGVNNKEKQCNLTDVVGRSEQLCLRCKNSNTYRCKITDVKVCRDCGLQE